MWLLALVLFLCKACWEVLTGILCWPVYPSYAEMPKVYFSDTPSTQIASFLSNIRPFRVPAWMAGPFVQTLLYFSMRSKQYPTVRTYIQMSDGVAVALDFKETPAMGETAPLIVVCHGLGSDSTCPLIERFTDECVAAGYRTVVYVRRGHSKTSLLPGAGPAYLYQCTPRARARPRILPPHADLEDMSEVTEALRALYPHSPKILVGISAGSNLIVRYLATDSTSYMAGISVANGHQLVELTKTLAERQYISDQLLKQKVMSLFTNHRRDIERLCQERGISLDTNAILGARTCRAYETAVLPLYGYDARQDVDEYYAENSSHRALEDVRVPLLCLASRDDPLIAPHLTEYAIEGARVNPWVLTLVTERGGHLGWLEGVGKSWVIDVMMQYVRTILHARK